MAAITSNKRPYGAGHFVIQLENSDGKTGWIKEVEGGHAEGEVITEKLGSDILFKKTISNVKYNDVSFKLGANGSEGLYKWIDASFKHEHNVTGRGRTNGSILCGDYDYNVVSTMDFHEAIISEVGMPALDAASKDAAAMSIKFTPEWTKYKPGLAGKMAKPSLKANQKMWTAANFKLTIDGIDDETLGKVTKIDALTIKQKIVQHYTGKNRQYEIEATSVETPNLVITVAEAYAKPFFDWHQQFVIEGRCEDANEKTAALFYLPQTASDAAPLFTLNFTQLGIFKISSDKTEQGDKIRYVKIEMYCEEIKFDYNKSMCQ